MRVLILGAGGVGSAAVSIAARRDFFDHLVVADYDLSRAQRAVSTVDDQRLSAARVDASSADEVAALCRAHGITHVLNAVDPRFVMPIFNGACAAGADYLDMAMSLSRPHTDQPYQQCGVKLGDEQFAADQAWRDAGRLALVGCGVEPGLSDVFARYAADHLFTKIDEIGVRDGANLQVDGYEFAPTFSIWTTIEECLNPPVVYEQGRGWYTTEPFSEPEVFEFGMTNDELYAAEADAVAQYIDDKECPYMTLADTLGNMKTLDMMRESAGMKFAAEMTA